MNKTEVLSYIPWSAGALEGALYYGSGSISIGSNQEVVKYYYDKGALLLRSNYLAHQNKDKRGFREFFEKVTNYI